MACGENEWGQNGRLVPRECGNYSWRVMNARGQNGQTQDTWRIQVSLYLEERSAEERRPEWIEGEAEECVGHLRLQK